MLLRYFSGDFMELLSAAALGIVQGLTEFLPISSSAHLIVVPWLLGWKSKGLMFDVALHVGTAIAVLAYFWRDWAILARESLAGLLTGNPFGNPERRLAWLIVVGTIPAAAMGLLFEEQVEQKLRSPLITVFTLIGLAMVLYVADRRSQRSRKLDRFTWADAIWIGLSQAVALIPGVSRSGITISTALLRNAERTAAARFSFLRATPVIVGAGILEGWSFASRLRAQDAASPNVPWDILAVGVICAAATGFLCIRFFMRYLQTRTFLPFVWYRMALALLVLIFYFRYF
jgi:undecaprenyl-diphosphatase